MYQGRIPVTGLALNYPRRRNPFHNTEVSMPIAREFAVVAPLANYLEEPLVVADVGCRWGFADTWSALGPHVRLVGFDPDAEEWRVWSGCIANRPACNSSRWASGVVAAARRCT